MNPKPTLRIRPLRPAVAANAATQLDLLIEVLPPAPPATPTTRPALNLALVIDRSGSMAGDPLSQARKAARFLARELSAADRLAVVSFDHNVRVLVPSQPVHDAAPFVQAINRIRCGGLTNLHGGWHTGAMQVAEHLNPKAINRVLLLSDGHTNAGITEAELIAAQVSGLSKRGISTSAFGLGDGFDEDLMGAIASGGDGTLAFIENPKQLPDLYSAELSGLQNTVCKRLSLGLRGCNGAEVEVLNKLHLTAFGNHQLPNLRFQQPLQIGVRLQLPAWQPNQPIASLRLAWEQPGKTTRHALVEELTLPVMEAAELAAMDPDPVVAEALALLQASIDRQRVIDALDADDLSSADQTLLAIANQLAALPSSAAIQCERQAIAQQRSLLRENRSRSRKHLRCDALRFSTNVWNPQQQPADD